MKGKTIFNLNKIIYALSITLAVELGIFLTVLVFDRFVDGYVVSKPFAQMFKIREEEGSFLMEESIKTIENSLVKITPMKISDIVFVDNELVKPIVYTNSIELSTLSIDDKKKTFINMLIPSILIAKHRISKDRERVGVLLKKEKISKEESLWLKKKKFIFKASTYNDLYEKMELHPTSIVIAQAIVESGWGTSRFFEKANNVFGIWSFNENEERIEASQKRGEKSIYLKKYSSIEESIFDYFLMISKKDAYEEFRKKRLESRDPFELIKYLDKYSELGDVYIENLKNTIEKNKLIIYDSYHLDI